MKQKVVIKLQMDCDKCRNKAMKIAAQVKGVTSVSLDGDDNDRVAVVGDNVDTVCLANQLKKKFSSVIILTVEDLNKKEAEEKKKKEEDKKKKDEEEEKKKQELEKLKKRAEDLCSALCSGKCRGHCNSKSTSSDEQLCVIMTCSKCKNSNCGGECNTRCPSWCTCSKCYVPFPNYNPCPPSYQVVYTDSYPSETCSIM